MEWLQEIDVSELPRQYREMAEIIGIEDTIRLAEYFGKTGVYFVSLDGIIREKKKQYVIKNFTGDNHRELARITNYSLVWIYDIIRDHKALSKIRQKVLFRVEELKS
ncbi:MAG TPA: Mor transcription activator family protein [Candidatus Wunengus sp. YC60]|uniref:Mor transcription activator family protein n=1 Tax=Candidatus Wunengus sp. YC60 TaxID=3367697 RepID=UPI00402686DA